MRRRAILTITTDFGGDGPYVAAMKGVVFGLTPEIDLHMIDVSHAVGPQNVAEGAFLPDGDHRCVPARDGASGGDRPRRRHGSAADRGGGRMSMVRGAR